MYKKETGRLQTGWGQGKGEAFVEKWTVV